MTLRQKFLFLFIPLVTLPLLLITLFLLYLFEKTTPAHLFQFFQISAFLFLSATFVLCVWMLSKIIHSVSDPIQSLTQRIKNISQNNF